jgi:hypothetical protein
MKSNGYVVLIPGPWQGGKSPTLYVVQEYGARLVFNTVNLASNWMPIPAPPKEEQS